jgi:2-haloacid dehalogenase
MSNQSKRPIQWLTFDVLGTCVDWLSSLSHDGPVECQKLDIQTAIDWKSFAVTWLGAYAEGIAAANGAGPWLRAEVIIRNGLEQALASVGVNGVSELQMDALCRLWDRLRPWPDAPCGLEKIRRGGRSLATLSNFGKETLEAIGAHGDLPWNRILSSETVRCYKPDPAVYAMAVEKLNVDPAKIMMVAAHGYDLEAASKAGFATAFVIRATEGPPPVPNAFDLVVADFDDLATQLDQQFGF